MAEDRKRTIMLVAGVLIPFIAGFILSYYIWGHNKKPVDYKQVLMETASYIGSMEAKNKELTTKVESLDAEVNVLRQKGQQSGAQNTNVITTLNQRVSALEGENQRLKAQIQGLPQQATTTGVK